MARVEVDVRSVMAKPTGAACTRAKAYTFTGEDPGRSVVGMVGAARPFSTYL